MKVAEMLNDGKFTKHQRFTIIFLLSFLVCFTVIGTSLWVISQLPVPPETPVIEALTQPFVVCDKVVKAGGVLKYKIHYEKRLDIPGELTKQLVGVSANGEIILIAADDTAGHLPLGAVKGTGFVKIPEYTPPGIYYLRLTATYDLPGRKLDRNISVTEKFEVVKP
jgi:hypothetical protein